MAASTTIPAAVTPPQVNSPVREERALPVREESPSRFVRSCHESHAWSRWMEWTADAARTDRRDVTSGPDPDERGHAAPPCQLWKVKNKIDDALASGNTK